MGFAGREFDFERRGAVAGRARRRLIADARCPPATLLNVNCPGGEAAGDRGHPARQAPLQRRAEARSRRTTTAARRYRIYGFEPSLRGRGGHRPRRGRRAARVSITPIHFDLTDHGGLERLGELGPRRDAARRGSRVAPEPRERRAAAKRGGRAAARRSRDARPRYYVLDDPTIGDDDYDELLRRAARRSRRRTPSCARRTRRRSGSAAAPLERFEQVRHVEPMLSLGNARGAEEFRAWETRAPQPPASGSTSRRASSATSPSRRSTGSRSRSPTRTACSSAARRAATGVIGEDVTQNLQDDQGDPAADRRRARS